MTVYRGEAAIYRARQVKTFPVGYCLKWVRQQYNIPPKYASAAQAWRNTPAKYRHTSQPPPRGYPCFWLGGSSGNGHVAIGLGGGWILTTDLPNGGRIGRVWWTEPAKQWGLPYAGWTTRLNDVGVWCRGVDLAKVQAAAVGRHGSYPKGTWAVQRSLWRQGLLAYRFVNGWWGAHTDQAWRKWCARIGVTVSSRPSDAALKRLARHEPHLIIRP